MEQNVLVQESEEELLYKAELERRKALKAQTAKLRSAIRRCLNKGGCFDLVEDPKLGPVYRWHVMGKDRAGTVVLNSPVVSPEQWALYLSVVNLPMLKRPKPRKVAA